MPTNPKFSNAAVNAEADALAALLNNGYLRIYSGAQPTNADTGLAGQTLLAELRFGNPAFGAAAAGVITANAITADAAADATGTATWYRALGSNGTSVYHDGSVGTSDANLVLNSVAIQTGVTVSVSAFAITLSKG